MTTVALLKVERGKEMHIYTEDGNVDKETGYLCRYVKVEHDQKANHKHEYFEFFIVARGRGIHEINGQEQILCEGDLLFIRDFDFHNYRQYGSEPFEFVNLAFSREVMYSMLAYLGENFPSRALLDAKMPPKTTLMKPQREALVYSMLDLDQSGDTQTKSLKFRALLVSVFSKYFFSFCDTEKSIPVWLSALYGKMKKPENFIYGTSRLFNLAGKSQEYVSRAFTKYYRVTPSAFVLDLRLRYAANLLVISNLPITEICYDSGFENLAWFYKAFGKKFGNTPLKYRKEHQKTV